MALAKQYGTAKKARAALKKKGGGAENLWRLKADEQFTVRFLQEPGDWYEAWQHYVGGEFVWCSDPDNRKRCPHCQGGDRPNKRALANVLERESGEVRILQMTVQLADSVVGKVERPITTADYEIWREGSGKETTKYGADRLDPTKCNISRYSLHDIEAALIAELGFDPDEADDEEEEEEPRSTRSSKPSRRREPEPEDEDDDEEEEEEDERPARRRPSKPASRPKRRSSHEDEDDEEEEDDEDEEEERPRRSLKKKRDGLDEFKPGKSRHPDARPARRLRK